MFFSNTPSGKGISISSSPVSNSNTFLNLNQNVLQLAVFVKLRLLELPVNLLN
jgi:hypothetical protein